MKIHFHVVLGMKEEDVLSLVKVVKQISITPNSMFEGVLQYYLYSVVRASNVMVDSTIANFSLMNLSDLITITNIMAERNNQ